MHHPQKSRRHQAAARARWARVADPEDIRPAPTDWRLPIDLNLSALGWRDVRLEPRLGYVSWRVVDVATGEVLHCAAAKESLRWIAGQVPRMMSGRRV